MEQAWQRGASCALWISLALLANYVLTRFDPRVDPIRIRSVLSHGVQRVSGSSLTRSEHYTQFMSNGPITFFFFTQIYPRCSTAVAPVALPPLFALSNFPIFPPPCQLHTHTMSNATTTNCSMLSLCHTVKNISDKMTKCFTNMNYIYMYRLLSCSVDSCHSQIALKKLKTLQYPLLIASMVGESGTMRHERESREPKGSEGKRMYRHPAVGGAPGEADNHDGARMLENFEGKIQRQLDRSCIFFGSH